MLHKNEKQGLEGADDAFGYYPSNLPSIVPWRPDLVPSWGYGMVGVLGQVFGLEEV